MRTSEGAPGPFFYYHRYLRLWRDEELLWQHRKEEEDSPTRSFGSKGSTSAVQHRGTRIRTSVHLCELHRVSADSFSGTME